MGLKENSISWKQNIIDLYLTSFDIQFMKICANFLPCVFRRFFFFLQELLKQKDENGVCKILIVGTGGLALWALRIAAYYFSQLQDKVTITIASLKDDGLLMAQEFQR